jgi:Rieske Fe-S protein
MNPTADVLALASIEVDLAPIEEGQSITVTWRGNPVIIRHRTAKEIEEAKATPTDDLPDRWPAIRTCLMTPRQPTKTASWTARSSISSSWACAPPGLRADRQ